MKKLQDVLNNYKSDSFDGRDLTRLAMFVKEEDLSKIGCGINEGDEGKHIPLEWTKENILKQLENDVSFGFEKALNQRGLSSGAMFNVVMMWNKILEDGLEDFDEDDYAQYGLPLFKQTAVLYSFDNPIGEDYGDEDGYGC